MVVVERKCCPLIPKPLAQIFPVGVLVPIDEPSHQPGPLHHETEITEITEMREVKSTYRGRSEDKKQDKIQLGTQGDRGGWGGKRDRGKKKSYYVSQE